MTKCVVNDTAQVITSVYPPCNNILQCYRMYLKITTKYKECVVNDSEDTTLDQELCGKYGNAI